MVSRRAVLVLWAAVTFSAIAAPTPAAASTVVPVTVETLAQRADEVLVVTPRAATSQWLGNVIATDYDLEVQTTVRGSVSAGTHLTLRAAGGSVGRISQEIPGVPALVVNHPYVVFLSRARDVAGVYYLAHLTAAVLEIAPATDGTPVALPATEGMVVQPTGPTNATRAIAPTAMVRGGVPLEQLVRALRSVQ